MEPKASFELVGRATNIIGWIRQTLQILVEDVLRSNVPDGEDSKEWWKSSLVHQDTRYEVERIKANEERGIEASRHRHEITYADLMQLWFLINRQKFLFGKILGERGMWDVLRYLRPLGEEVRKEVAAHQHTAPDLTATMRALWLAQEILRSIPSKYHAKTGFQGYKDLNDATITSWTIACQEVAFADMQDSSKKFPINDLSQKEFESDLSFLKAFNPEYRIRLIKVITRFQRKNNTSIIPRENLANVLDYSPTFIKGAFDEDERELRLFRNSIQCFEKLFPDLRDRCSEKDLEQWLREDYKKEYTDKWRSVYAVLHADDDVFGMAYLSLHLDSSWAYVSYLGILQGWRDLGRADKFIKDVVKYIQDEILPTLKGIIFEIDPIEFTYLKELGEISSELNRDDFDEQTLFQLRSLKRLKLFQNYYKSAMVLGRDELPLTVWQPPLTKTLDTTDEKELILMVKPIKQDGIKDIELQDVLDFVYDILYMDAYNTEDNEAYIAEFHRYVAEVKRRVEAKARKGWSIKPLEIPKEIDQLFTRASMFNLEDQLDL